MDQGLSNKDVAKVIGVDARTIGLWREREHIKPGEHDGVAATGRQWRRFMVFDVLHCAFIGHFASLHIGPNSAKAICHTLAREGALYLNGDPKAVALALVKQGPGGSPEDAFQPISILTSKRAKELRRVPVEQGALVVLRQYNRALKKAGGSGILVDVVGITRKTIERVHELELTEKLVEAENAFQRLPELPILSKELVG